MTERIDITQIQGNILRGYRRRHVRHLILEVHDRREARKWLGLAASGGGAGIPAITRESESKWESDKKPDLCFNLGFTFAGLRALGLPEDGAKTLSTEFVEGMQARALKLGDVGDSDPAKWIASFRDPKRMHVFASLYADDEDHIKTGLKQIVGRGSPWKELDCLTGQGLDGGKVHFGYTDNISQPRFKEIPDPDRDGETEPFDPLGTILLGHSTTFEGLRWRDLQKDDLLFNGTFNAFRMMKQDVEGFEKYLDEAAQGLLAGPENEVLLARGDEAHFEKLLADVYGPGKDLPEDGWKRERMKATRHNAMREVVAAQLCGRWRNGLALAQSPDRPDDETEAKANAFEYPNETRCPAGSHVRRCNPRGGQIVQRVANYSRRIIRRGMAYGPLYGQGDPAAERGLLGNFIGASLGAQFEAMMCDWLNLGLHNPEITGSNDPLIGANSPETSWFDMRLKDGRSLRLRGFKRFVTTRAGAYVFLPSLNAVEKISKWSD